MCYFVAIGLPTDHRSLAGLFRERGLTIALLDNESVRAFFPTEDAVFWVQGPHCACDLFAVRSPPLDERLDRAKFERRGWSRTKIERAFEQRRGHVQPMKEEARVFREALRAIAEELGAVRLHAHMYSGNQSAENVPAPAPLEWTLDDFASHGGAWPEDTLLTLKAT